MASTDAAPMLNIRLRSKVSASGGKSNACAGENMNSPDTITQPTVMSTTTSMTTARRPMSSMLRQSRAVAATQTDAAIRWCATGDMPVHTNCR